MQRRFWLSVVAGSLLLLQNAFGATDYVSGQGTTIQSGSGYTQGVSGYTQNGTGYTPTGTGYPPPNSGYAPPSSGYTTTGTGFTQPSGYTQSGAGYQATGTGYTQGNPGYVPGDPGYSQNGSGYLQPGPGLVQQGQGYPPPNQAGAPGMTNGTTQQAPNMTAPGSVPRDTRLAPAVQGQQRMPMREAGTAPPPVAQGAPSQEPGYGAGWPEPMPQPSAIEKALLEEAPGLDNSQSQRFSLNDLSQFGYSFFRPDTAIPAALAEAPVGPEYVVGVGDRLLLTLWGSTEATVELEVNRNGEVMLPKAGALKVAGVRFGELPALMKGHLSRMLKDFQLSVNMSKLHLIKVYVVGEVKSPGDYHIISLSTVLNALSAAGGPTKNGSLRDIQIKRDGKLLHSVDLYDFFLKGDKSRDIRLQSGDTIFVPVIGQVAGIAGNVKRPGIYELKGDKNLKELLSLAGGVNSAGYLQRVQLLRVEKNQKKAVAEVSLDAKEGAQSLEEMAGRVRVQDMDLVKVFPIDQSLRNYVRLTGHLLRPGDYALPADARLSQVLLPENLLPEYYQEAAELTRLYPPDYHPERSFFNLQKALKGEAEHDLKLQEFDVVRVFPRWEMEEVPTVRISGDVQRPGEYRLFPNMTVKDLVMQAGNAKLTAYMKSAEISRIKSTGGKVMSYPINVNLEQALQGVPGQNVALEPFDEVTVRRIPNWAEETDRYITLRGEFQFPGTYPIYKGEKLSTLIERAGGFTDKAYLKAAKFTRQMVREEQQLRMDELLAKSEQDIARKQGELASVASSAEELAATKASLEGLMRTVEKLKTAKAEGRMVINLADIAQSRESPYDLELMGGDMLYVPKTPNSVMVLGQVYNPTTFVQLPGKDVAFYLQKAGGATTSADLSEMYIVRADGTLQSRPNHKSFLFFNTFDSVELDSGDAIVVPQRLERIALMREVKDIATILGQIALTAGVVLAAGL